MSVQTKTSTRIETITEPGMRSVGRRPRHIAAKTFVFFLSLIAGWTFAWLVRTAAYESADPLKAALAPIGLCLHNLGKIVGPLVR
jgi:hypothetical protein